MGVKGLRGLTHLAWTLLIVTSALYFLSDNEADNDLWIHLLIGKQIIARASLPRVDDLSYTAAGSPWVDHEWLAQTLFAGVFDLFGTTGLWLLKTTVGLLTAWLLWRPVARRSSSAWACGPATVLALAVLARGFAMRPQIITYVAIAGLLAWLDRPGSGGVGRPAAWKVMAGMATFMLIWANAHGGFIVGLGMLGLFAASGLWEARLSGRSAGPGKGKVDRWRWGVLLAATVAACINPYGPSLFGYIWNELYVPHPLTEWQAVTFGHAAHRPFLLMLAATVLTLPFADTLRRRPWWTALVVVVAVLGLRHQRHTPLLALCATAPLAEQLGNGLDWARRRTTFTLSSPATAAVASAIFVLAAVQVWSLTHRLVRDRLQIVYLGSEYPVGAVRFMQAEQATGNVALPLDWGSYVLWHGAPDLKVSLDGRFATVYPPSVVEANFAFFRNDDAAATRLLDEHATTHVLAPHGTTTPVQGRSNWHLRYRDRVADLFAKEDARPTVVGQAPLGRIPFP